MTTRAQLAAEKNWQTIVELSNGMLEAALGRDWSTLTALMDARDKLMKLYFSVAEEEERLRQGAGANNDADVAALSQRIALLKQQIEIIQSMDNKILQYTQENKAQLGNEIGKLRNARKMVEGYKQD